MTPQCFNPAWHLIKMETLGVSIQSRCLSPSSLVAGDRGGAEEQGPRCWGTAAADGPGCLVGVAVPNDQDSHQWTWDEARMFPDSDHLGDSPLRSSRSHDPSSGLLRTPHPLLPRVLGRSLLHQVLLLGLFAEMGRSIQKSGVSNPPDFTPY